MDYPSLVGLILHCCEEVLQQALQPSVRIVVPMCACCVRFG